MHFLNVINVSFWEIHERLNVNMGIFVHARYSRGWKNLTSKAMRWIATKRNSNIGIKFSNPRDVADLATQGSSPGTLRSQSQLY